MYYIFSFRSRTESICFFECLIKKGVNAKLISTPRAISLGCGLSVKICPEPVDTASELLCQNDYGTFLGLFYYNGSEIVRIKKF